MLSHFVWIEAYRTLSFNNPQTVRYIPICTVLVGAEGYTLRYPFRQPSEPRGCDSHLPEEGPKMLGFVYQGLEFEELLVFSYLYLNVLSKTLLASTAHTTRP